MLAAAKYRAKKRGLVCTLEKADIVIPAVCPLLGIPIFTGGPRMGDNAPSIDRLDATVGYTRENSWVISWRANRIKDQATPIELRLIADGVERGWRFWNVQ